MKTGIHHNTADLTGQPVDEAAVNAEIVLLKVKLGPRKPAAVLRVYLGEFYKLNC